MLGAEDDLEHGRHLSVDVLSPPLEPVPLALLIEQVTGDSSVVVRSGVNRGQPVTRQKPHLGDRQSGG